MMESEDIRRDVSDCCNRGTTNDESDAIKEKTESLRTQVPDTRDDKETASVQAMEESVRGVCAVSDSCAASASSEADSPAEEVVDFKVIFNKQKYDVSFALDKTIVSLKKHLETIIDVPSSLQKVMFKGLCKDDQSLRDIGVIRGVKVMVVGSTLSDVLAINTPTVADIKEDKSSVTQKEPFCKQKLHKKVLDKGIPEDVLPGIKNVKEGLPPFPLAGMVNKSGGKVRLTFKLELDQVWIGTKERTDKIPMNTIKAIVNEPIEGHEEYHIMGIQMGTTDASRYWLYWVPAQYVDAIKDAILGKWQYF